MTVGESHATNRIGNSVSSRRYNESMNDTYTKAVMSLVDDILKPAYKFRCPECGQTFTDPEEYAYGHDCEAE